MPDTEYDIECIEKAKALIDADTSVHYSIKHIAMVAGIGSTKLKKGFREQYRHSLFAYLRKQRMIKAADLLSTTSKTIKQIAKATGFKYIGNFTRAFTLHYKIPPALYRINKKDHKDKHCGHKDKYCDGDLCYAFKELQTVIK